MPLDAEPPNHTSLQRDENLDVVRRSRDQESVEPDPLLSVVCPFPAPPVKQRKHRGRYRERGSKVVSVPQANKVIEALEFAKSIGLPLVAHLTIHWSGTIAFDDHAGTRFAKVREGLAKILVRRGIPAAWVWCRECKAHTDIVHSHLLFHLPVEYRSGPTLDEMKAHLDRLVDHHGEGILGEFAVKLKLWPDPDGLYPLRAVAPMYGSGFLGSGRTGASRKASFAEPRPRSSHPVNTGQ